MSTSSASSVLLKDLRPDGICVLTINRPDAMNAMNGELVEAFRSQFLELFGDPSIRVVILTGSGDRVFCAGADLKERAKMSPKEVSDRILAYGEAFTAISGVDKPVICALNGHAFGGGLEIALSCDIRVLAEEAQVGLTELHLGIIPGAGGTQRLARLIGASKAKDLMFRAARLKGSEAVAWGVVNYATPRENLLNFAIDLAKQMTKAAPIAVAQAKLAVDQGMDMMLEDALRWESECYAQTIPTEDRLEGLAAFAEKREPVWKGR